MLLLLTFSIPLLLSASGSSIAEIRRLCRRAVKCTECANLHPACAWCLDPNMTTHYHCDIESELLKKYKSTQIYRPQNKVRYLVDNLIGSPDDRDPNIKLQMRPQRVQLSIMPNSDYRVNFTYVHLSSRYKDLILRSSSISKNHGITVAFSIICHGREVQGMQCSNVSVGEVIQFFVYVRLRECRGGNESLSIGAYGYDGVNALYIKELCGCECEEIDELPKGFLSPICNRRGDLNCGECVCRDGYGGNRCQCPLNGATKEDLLNFCKKSPDSEVCSGNGICECGRCKCQKEHIQGEFCECDSLSCPVADGKICSGHGRCNCGTCECEPGYVGEDCSCSLDKRSCMEGSLVCNGHGTCECGMCKCEDGYSGHTCGMVNERDQVDDFDDGASDQQPEDIEPTIEPTNDVNEMATVTDKRDENDIQNSEYGYKEEYIAKPSTSTRGSIDNQDIDHTSRTEENDGSSEDKGKVDRQTHEADTPATANQYGISLYTSIFILLYSVFVLFYLIRIE